MKRIPTPFLRLLPVALCTALAGCAASVPDVQPVRPANIDASAKPTLPMVLLFEPGDRIPVDLGIDGDLMALEGSQEPAVVVVKRRFFLVMTDDAPPRISLDGKSLGQVSGSVSVGLGVTKERGAVATVRLGAKSK